MKTELEKEVAQRLEKIRINSSYYRLSDNNFDLFDAYGVKDVNSFYKEYKRKLYWEKRTKFWNQRRQEILDKKSTGSSSRFRTDYNLAYQRD